jgi:vancomycin aglycone glucosyltransferase
MLALAVALRARGHTVSFSAPSNFLAWIRASGFEVASNGVDIEADIQAPDGQLESARWQFRHLKDHTARMFEPIARASEGADLIVGAGAQLVTPSIAEWRDVPHATVAFCPCAVPGSGAPPPTVHTQTFPPFVNLLFWRLGAPVADLLLRGTINRGRAALGLAPTSSPLSDLISTSVLIAADRDLAARADAEDNDRDRVVYTDAWIFDEPQPPDPRIEAFLGAGAAPIYVGFGSMVAPSSRALVTHAIDAARAVGRRLILAGGWAGLERGLADEEDLLAVNALSHADVLPRVAVAVHHGGAGTTTASARAGVPQVILPHVLDQYYWAHRVERLGLGPGGLPIALVNADVLTARLDRALNDPRMRARASALGGAIATRNGVAPAVEHLERIART